MQIIIMPEKCILLWKRIIADIKGLNRTSKRAHQLSSGHQVIFPLTIVSGCVEILRSVKINTKMSWNHSTYNMFVYVVYDSYMRIEKVWVSSYTANVICYTLYLCSWKYLFSTELMAINISFFLNVNKSTPLWRNLKYYASALRIYYK